MANIRHVLKEGVYSKFTFYVEHNNKTERSLLETWREEVLYGRDVLFVTEVIYQPSVSPSRNWQGQSTRNRSKACWSELSTNEEEKSSNEYMQKKMLHRNRKEWVMVHWRIKLTHTKDDTTWKQKTIRSHNKLYLERTVGNSQKIKRWRKCEGCDEGLLEVEPCWSRPKKDSAVVSRTKERASVVCKRKSLEGQNRTGLGKGRVLRKGERRSSRKGQKSAESRALRLLSAVGATGVPVARALEHRERRMWGWRLNSARKHGWCCKLQGFLWHNRGWSVKALDVIFIFPSIGWQRHQRACRITSIGCLLEAECLFFICTWRIPSIGISTCGASAKEEMHMRSWQRTFCSTRTYICWRGLREKRSRGCVHSVHRRAARPETSFRTVN